MPDTAVFSALLDRDNYMPGLWDLVADEEARRYWMTALRKNSRHMLDSYTEKASPEMHEKCRRAHVRFCRFLDDFESELDPNGPRTVNEVVEIRRHIFTEHGIPDPYRDLKRRDNERALAMLGRSGEVVPAGSSERELLRWIVSLVMAGNLVDMGSAEARKLNRDAKTTVFDRTAELAGKAWFRDELGELEARLKDGPREDGSIVICTDNAGAEMVLGVTTLVKHLATLGYSSVIAANEVPALNDMTAGEATELFQTMSGTDPELRSLFDTGKLRLISSGSVTSGLDMMKVSREFDACASGAEMLVVIGQGRAVETNWNTRLSIPWARIASVKDPAVAGALGCEVFDPLLTYEGV